MNQFGVATITVLVEDGGLDNDLTSANDNATYSQSFDVTVTALNDTQTGTITITGTPREEEVLVATHTLADGDGLGAISWQWSRGGLVIDGATNSSYTLVQADVGSSLTVTASYIDGDSTAETVTSSSTSIVLNVNDSPTGTVTIAGTASRRSSYC